MIQPFAVMAAIIVAFFTATMTGRLLAAKGFPLPDSDRRIGCIDGLRGYLALSVFAHHSIIWSDALTEHRPWSRPSIRFFENLGSGGVSLFFMTTGLLFYPKIRAGIRASDWRAVYLTRLFRIEPLILVSTLVMSLIVFAQSTQHMVTFTDVSAILRWSIAATDHPIMFGQDAGLLNAFVLWTLRYEWVFYFAILPASALCMSMRGKVPAVSIVIFAIFAALTLRHFVEFPLSKQLPLFLVGMLAWEVQAIPKLANFLAKRTMSVIAIGSLTYSTATSVDPYSITQLMLYGVFFVSVASGNDIFGAFETRGSLVLGECSYSIYLLHGLVLYLLLSRLADPNKWLLIASLPLIAIALVCVASIAYLRLERPADAFGRRLAKRWFRWGVDLNRQQLDIAP